MSDVQVPVRTTKTSALQPGVAQVFVSLDDSSARGIHMSRLFKTLQDVLPSETLSHSLLAMAADQILQSHQGLSHKVRVQIDTTLLLARQSLKSEIQSMRSYPVTLEVEKTASGETHCFLKIKVTYSSTCPASAALSRQIVRDSFLQKFANEAGLSLEKVAEWLASEEGMSATPHAQRSYAELRLELASITAQTLQIAEEWIVRLEDVLATPVQTFVKRVDEQEFARRNAENLMFCEDAARRVQERVRQDSAVLHFQGEFRHAESLHPHDAVARIHG